MDKNNNDKSEIRSFIDKYMLEFEGARMQIERESIERHISAKGIPDGVYGGKWEWYKILITVDGELKTLYCHDSVSVFIPVTVTVKDEKAVVKNAEPLPNNFTTSYSYVRTYYK